MNRDELIEYVKMTYGTEPDYPWGDFDGVVLRNDSNKKWYAVIMGVNASRLGLSGDEIVDIVNVKCDPIMISSLKHEIGFLPAYHMNKEHWLTIRLDGTASDDDIKSLIDISYELTKPKSKKKTVKDEF